MPFNVEPVFDPESCTYSYLLSDSLTQRCAIIDPVLDYDTAAARISYVSADRLIEHVRVNGLTLEWILETHVHADHLSAARYLQEHLGGQIGIGPGLSDSCREIGAVRRRVRTTKPSFFTVPYLLVDMHGDGLAFP